jgi:hypothetical protein
VRRAGPHPTAPQTISFVKTVRFSQVVAKSGKPEIYLTLTAPAKDRHLQSAIKAHKVMTLRQDNAGSKVDRGEIGFEEGPERQYLIFPRSLQRFADHKVVGIKYDLIAEPEISARQLAPPPREKKKHKPAATHAPALAKALAAAFSEKDGEGSEPDLTPPPKSKSKSKKRPREAEPKTRARPKQQKASSTNAEVATLKKLVRKAMSELEKGKAVAAFNLLKQIADA